MSRKQLAALFACNTIVLTVGLGLIPLLPVLATQLGATPLLTGFYLSFSYLTLTAGTLAAGWLSDRLQRRKLLLMLGGMVMIPAIWLMGRATNVWQLAALTATVWFCGGLQLTSTVILAGLFAEQSERGKVFGILAMAAAVGQLIGGSVVGTLVDRWNYATMFSALSLFAVLSPLSGALTVDKRVLPAVRTAQSDHAETRQKRPGLGRSFLLLIAARLMVSVASHGSTLGRSLHMDSLGFAATAISSLGAISGAVQLPLPPIAGWLSDRLGRRRLLIFGYLAAAGGFLTLARSVSLWHFWVGGGLSAVAGVIAGSVGQALVTDLVPPGSLGRGLSLFEATLSVGAILGFTAGGYATESLGVTSVFVAGALLSLVATGLITLTRRHAPRSSLAKAPEGADPPDAC